MGTAREFEIGLDKLFKDQVEGKIVEATKLLAMEALQRVVMKSPVDTGRFRGNWRVTIGSPASTPISRIDKGGGTTIGVGSSVIGRINEPRVVYLTNNLPYAVRLEEGWSKQAPAGMVAVTIAELQAFFSKL